MRITEIIESGTHTHVDQNLNELTFMGSQCTKDCSGHRAGYQWSVARGGVENPASPSQSFINGSNIGHRKVTQNKQQRTQGGGKIAGYQSQTPDAERKRRARAQARVNQGVQGTPDPEQQQDTDMRLNEFAPSPGHNGGGDERPGMPWNQFASQAMRWMKSQGFSAHPVGDDVIQFSKQHSDYDDSDPYAEEVWLQAIIENNGDDTFNYMMASITNGEIDAPMDDYKGTARMDAQGLNHFILLAEDAFGLG
jgi:hypothetical protein